VLIPLNRVNLDLKKSCIIKKSLVNSNIYAVDTRTLIPSHCLYNLNCISCIGRFQNFGLVKFSIEEYIGPVEMKDNTM
jgi:hypothetical protein